MNNFDVYLDKNIINGSYENFLVSNKKKYAELYIERTGQTFTVKPIYPESAALQWLESKSKPCTWLITKIHNISISSSGSTLLEKIEITDEKTLPELIIKKIDTFYRERLIERMFTEFEVNDPFKTEIAFNINDYTTNPELVRAALWYLFCNEELKYPDRYKAGKQMLDLGFELDQLLLTDFVSNWVNSNDVNLECIQYILANRARFSEETFLTAVKLVFENPKYKDLITLDLALEIFKKQKDLNAAVYLINQSKFPGVKSVDLLPEIADYYLSNPIYTVGGLELVFDWINSLKITVDVNLSCIKTILTYRNRFKEETVLTATKIIFENPRFHLLITLDLALEIFKKEENLKAAAYLLNHYNLPASLNRELLTRIGNFYMSNESYTIKGLDQIFSWIESKSINLEISFFLETILSSSPFHIINYPQLFFNNILALKKEDQLKGCKHIFGHHYYDAKITNQAADYLCRYFPEHEPAKVVGFILDNQDSFKKGTILTCIKRAIKLGLPLNMAAFHYIFAVRPDLFNLSFKFKALLMAVEKDLYSSNWDATICDLLNHGGTGVFKQLEKYLLKRLFSSIHLQNWFNYYKNRYHLRISKIDLKSYPEDILKIFYPLSRANPQIDNFFVEVLDNQGKALAAVDQGGVSRSFLTDLSRSLSSDALCGIGSLKFIMTDNGAMPVATNKYEETTCYLSLGKIMGMCCTSTYSYTLGQLFSPFVYHAMTAIPFKEVLGTFQELSKDTLVGMYKALEKNLPLIKFLEISSDQLESQEILDYAFTIERPKELAGTPSLETIRSHFITIKAALSDQVLTLAKNDQRLLPIFLMAQGIARHQRARLYKNEMPKNLGPSVQGQFSKTLLKEVIVNHTLDLFKIWVEQWVDESSEDLCQKFIFAATGSETITQGSKIYLENFVNATIEHLPTFHTCVRYLDLPLYPDYKTFKLKLEKAIELALAGNGFQLR